MLKAQQDEQNCVQTYLTKDRVIQLDFETSMRIGLRKKYKKNRLLVARAKHLLDYSPKRIIEHNRSKQGRHESGKGQLTVSPRDALCARRGPCGMETATRQPSIDS